MGILSRKMAMGCNEQVVKPLSTVDLTNKVSDRTIQHLGVSRINVVPTNDASFITPVLGHKNYGKKVE